MRISEIVMDNAELNHLKRVLQAVWVLMLRNSRIAKKPVKSSKLRWKRGPKPPKKDTRALFDLSGKGSSAQQPKKSTKRVRLKRVKLPAQPVSQKGSKRELPNSGLKILPSAKPEGRPTIFDRPYPSYASHATKGLVDFTQGSSTAKSPHQARRNDDQLDE